MRIRAMAVGVALAVWAGLMLGAVTAGAWAGPRVSVDGAVAAPASYGVGDLAALPQTTAQVTLGGRAHTVRGVLLEDLATRSRPTLPNAKNASLRVVLTVHGAGVPVALALGELDPSFGNHPALLAIAQDGATLVAPELVVPGDSAPIRFLSWVNRVTVGVESPAVATPPAGGLEVSAGGRTTTLSAAALAALPARTARVTFEAGTAPQTHTESGPSLAAVLAAAHVVTLPSTWVAGVGSDGYVATVTPAEAAVGGRTLLVSTVEDGAALAQPRLVVGGDVKGGRYVSGMVRLAAGWR